jgi:hypothetical protein
MKELSGNERYRKAFLLVSGLPVDVCVLFQLHIVLRHCYKYLQVNASVADLSHFGVDPDLDPRIHASD